MRRWIHWIHVTSQRIEMCGADMELFLIYSFICRLLVYDYYHFFCSVLFLFSCLILLRFVATPADWRRLFSTRRFGHLQRRPMFWSPERLPC